MPNPFSFDVKLQQGCGIYLHKDSIKCCLMLSDGKILQQNYGTTSHQLRMLCSALQSCGIKDVLIASTSI